MAPPAKEAKDGKKEARSRWGRAVAAGVLFFAGAALAVRAAEPPPAKWDPVAGRKLAVEALGRCGKGEIEACAQGLRRALELQPGHLEFLQLLASAEERLGHPDAALAALARIHRQGFELTFDPPDEWVAKVMARPEYRKVLAETAAARAPVVRSSEAFRLPYREMIPESVAYDPRTGDFFVGSVRERRIVRRKASGTIEDFVPAGQGGLWSVLGMAVDPGRRRLWAASSAYPPMQGFEASLAGRSALFCFDLDSGKLVGRYESERPGKKGFNDVRVADGAVFVTDHEERPGTLYRLDPETLKLAPFGDPEALGSPEGMALSPDGRYLFVADYSYGIVRYELATGKHLYLADPPDSTLIGLDHLDYYADAGGGALIAVQNGNRPNSVIRLPLSPGQDRILGIEVLEKGHPAYSDPALGVLVGDDLYYVATSQWGKLDDDGKLAPAAELVEPLILRLPLARTAGGRP